MAHEVGMLSSVVGAALILIGWVLFVYFLFHSPTRGGGWINLNLPSWTIFAAPLVSLRDGIRNGEIGVIGMAIGAAFLVASLFLILPMSLAPVLIPLTLVWPAEIKPFVFAWACVAAILVCLLCILAFITSDDRSEFVGAFYFWPISSIAITVGLFLL